MVECVWNFGREGPRADPAVGGGCGGDSSPQVLLGRTKHVIAEAVQGHRCDLDSHVLPRL